MSVFSGCVEVRLVLNRTANTQLHMRAGIKDANDGVSELDLDSRELRTVFVHFNHWLAAGLENLGQLTVHEGDLLPQIPDAVIKAFGPGSRI